MPIVAETGAVSTLADVLGQVVDAFEAMADPTPILVGEMYLEAGVGADPRVVFVPETQGKVGPAIEMGSPASIQHGCQVYVSAQASYGEGREGDIQRYRDAYALGDKVIGCIAVAAAGRIEWTNYNDSSPLNTDDYGAELTFGFTYKRAVAPTPARWSLAAADADTTAVTPRPPPGQAGMVKALNVTTVPDEPEDED
jgi:hypothetical protein